MLNYYIYRHIRLDKNEPFYIGLGTKKDRCTTYESIYHRAYTHYKRNSHWRKIVAKTLFEVEILFETDDYDFIKKKEKEFIQLYGRKDLETGTLCNFTEGGEGHDKSPISKAKFRNSQYARKWNQILQYDTQGNFVGRYNGCNDAERKTGYSHSSICRVLIGQRSQYDGYIWIYEKEFSSEALISKINNIAKIKVKVIEIRSDGTSKEWDSINQAAKKLNIDRGSITKVCKGQRKLCNKSKWYYKTYAK